MACVIVENDRVTNIIHIRAQDIESFAASSGLEIINDSEYGLNMGDYREDGSWYRDIDGVKTQLPLPEPEPTDYAAYYNAMREVIDGE